MTTGDLILYMALAAAYIVTVGPLVMRIIEVSREGKKGADGRDGPTGSEPISVTPSEDDWEALRRLSRGGGREVEEVATQAMRLGLRALENSPDLSRDSH